MQTIQPNCRALPFACFHLTQLCSLHPSLTPDFLKRRTSSITRGCGERYYRSPVIPDCETSEDERDQHRNQSDGKERLLFVVHRNQAVDRTCQHCRCDELLRGLNDLRSDAREEIDE